MHCACCIKDKVALLFVLLQKECIACCILGKGAQDKSALLAAYRMWVHCLLL